MNPTRFRAAFISLLDDCHGISQEAYDNLVLLALPSKELSDAISDVLPATCCVEGRYFLLEDHGLE